MTAIWLNPVLANDDERRGRLYAGDIIVYSHIAAVEALAAFTRDLLEELFRPYDPRTVHEVYSPEELAPILAKFKPQFIHHPESRRLTIGIVEALGGDLSDYYLDVPKLRTAYPTGHLTKGIAFAFGAHRDTWYGAPQAQINWWMPVYPLSADNAMVFYPRYFSARVANDSANFNYYRRNLERVDVSKFVHQDPRIQPEARDLAVNEPEFRLLPEVGGIILFSGTQLHASASSPTSLARYSVDFRTVSRRDVESSRGAENLDACAVGTALRDFRRCTDWSTMPDDLVRRLDPMGPREGEVAVFTPEG